MTICPVKMAQLKQLSNQKHFCHKSAALKLRLESTGYPKGMKQ